MSVPLISVIVPVYNAEGVLQECVDSVIGQSYGNFELILVDDGSTDSSGALCDQLSSTDSRIKVMHKKNGGQSSARNLALDVTKGEFVTFLDSDDYWEPQALENLLNACEKYSAEIACMGVRTFSDTHSSIKYTYLKDFAMTPEEAFRRMLICDGLDSNGIVKLYRSTLWDTVRFPEGFIFEDVPIMYKILLGSSCVAHAGFCGYNYRRIEMQSTTSTPFRENKKIYTQFTKEVLLFTNENLPKYKKEARYFYLNSVLVNSFTIAKNHQQKEFRSYYAELKKTMVQNLFFILKSKWFSFETKISVILVLLNLYSSVRAVIKNKG